MRKIHIRVKLYATLRRHLPNTELGEEVAIEVPERVTIEEVITQLGIDLEEAKIILVNGIRKTLNDILEENDLLVIFPPVGGGTRLKVKT
ncbi:MAG: MoaD/ThiS family protein [Candidatus Hermodarchaeota archaeon]